MKKKHAKSAMYVAVSVYWGNRQESLRSTAKYQCTADGYMVAASAETS